MKSNNNKYFAVILIFVLTVFTAGCKFDVAEPQWEKDFTEPATPIITEVIPAQAAVPGVNTLTINGQNFATTPDVNSVYFDNVSAEILSSSANSILLRRPNIVSDNCVIKVVSSSALVVVKHEPYKVDAVLTRYGNFLENLELSVLAVDELENLYVVESTTRNIIKFTPGGDRSVIGTTTRPAFDAVVHNGKMYMPENNRAIDVVNLQTGEVSQWIRLPSGRVVQYGDFDDEGYYYCGGRRSRLVIVAPDEVTVTDTDELYRQDEILDVRVHNGYVYVNVSSGNPDEQTPEFAIWRHALLGGGAVGEKELVLNFADFGATDSTELVVTKMNFSSDDKMYLTVNNANSLLVYDLAAKKMDIFYKGILPGYAKFFNWGKSSYMYMITGDTDLGEEWTVYRVDMGMEGS